MTATLEERFAAAQTRAATVQVAVDVAHDADLATTSPCPKCKTPVRRLSFTPVGGSGYDVRTSGPWHCPACIQKRCAKAWTAASKAGRTIPPPKPDEPQENT